MQSNRLTVGLVNLALGGLAVVLIFANVRVAGAHDWWHWHWHTGNTIEAWVGGQYKSTYEAVLNEWDQKTDIRFPRSSSHTELSVFDGDYGATGWGGLASIEEKAYDWWHKWDYSEIKHCHSRVNLYYAKRNNWSGSDIRGIQCQEVGHCLGLDHSNDGCMGKWYFNDSNSVSSHNVSDVNAKY